MLKGKRVLSLILVGVMFLGSISVHAEDQWMNSENLEAAEDLTVHFQEKYAEIGQVLSAAANTSDVTYQWFVGGEEIENEQSFYIPTENDLEKWIEVKADNGLQTVSDKIYCSKLPVIYIDTENGQEITSKETYIDAEIKIQGNSEYKDSNLLYNGKTQIKGRGNSTWYQPKKPYRLKLDEKADVFGMGESKHWVLLANYLDESLMRNTLSYDFSGVLGLEHMSTVWVDVILNGEYIGNYQFCENIRVDKERVDIYDWEEFAEEAADVIAAAERLDKAEKKRLKSYMTEVMDWITTGTVQTYYGASYDLSKYPEIRIPDRKGGYLLELDESYDEISKFRTNNGQPIMFKSPEYVKTNNEMMNYVQGYVQAFEDSVQSEDYRSWYDEKYVHYSDLYDFQSLVDYWLVSEIFFNEEFNKRSTFMYQAHNGKMFMGPIWDMDHSSGSQVSRMGDTADQWATTVFETNAQYYQWYKYLVKDPYFLMKVQERYWMIRDTSLQDIFGKIDEYYEYLKESGTADYKKWNRISFESGTNDLKQWLNTHITWMDAQMAEEDLFDQAFMSKNRELVLSLTDINGKQLAKDITKKAPADVTVDRTTDLLLHVKCNDAAAIKIYVNSRLAATEDVEGSEFVYEILASALTEPVENKNVIEVKMIDSDGKLLGSNYITVKQQGCAEHSYEWIIDHPAGEFTTGVQHEECSVCYAKRNENTEIPAKHVHKYSEDWKYDAGSHWKECTCEVKTETSNHSYRWVIDHPAGEFTTGIQHEECSVCHAKRSENTEINSKTGICRLSGATRYKTSFAIADFMKEKMGISKFETVIVASGRNGKEADALSGSYLAVVKNAPILLTNETKEQITELYAYIRENVAAGGKIYILGGESALPNTVESIGAEGYDVKRLEGSTRYETSVAILNEAGITGDEIIVATGKTFADSLSASATGRPILLVKPNQALSEAQKRILEKVRGGKIYIAGGINAVTTETEKELQVYGNIIRRSGGDRYETSVLIAEEFFADAEKALIANGATAADGLCGGPLAYYMKAPLVLTKAGAAQYAKGYLAEYQIQSGYVLGGSAVLNDPIVKEVFSLN